MPRFVPIEELLRSALQPENRGPVCSLVFELWKAIDAKRLQAGMAPIALAKPDKESTYLNCQVEHVEIAGALLLGRFKDEEIDVRRFKLT